MADSVFRLSANIGQVVSRCPATAAAAFREFLEWIHSPAAGAGDGNEVSALVRDFPRAWRCAPALPAVTGAHLARALDDLLDAAQAVTRTLLGVGGPPDLPSGAR